jgi:DNA repair protein RadD
MQRMMRDPTHTPVNAQGQAILPLVSPVLIEAASVIPVDWLDVLPRQADCLRDYQRRQIAELARALRNWRRILMQAPTGAGKTHMIAAIIMAAILADLRVLVLATRTRLVRQIHDRLVAFEVRHGVVAATLPNLRDYSAPVQVAGVDTLHRRALVSGKMPMPAADVVIFDEAHLATAKTRLRVLNSYPKALRIGFTATPARKSGLSLAAAFDHLVLGPTVSDLTAAGVLVSTRIFNTPLVTPEELRALPKDIDNDFQPKALGDLLSRPKLIGDVIMNWLRIANGKRTICFAVNKAHGAALLDAFRRQGIAAEMLTDADDEVTREQVIGRLESGDTMVVINCFLLSYGIDIPSVECICLARPTRSLVQYLQMVGRGLRASPGKTHCILIDHGHVVENLGLPQTEHEWTLDDGRNVNREALENKGFLGTAAETVRTCGDCAALWLTSEQGGSCPECGWEPPLQARAIAVEDADLEEMADAGETATPFDARVMDFYCEALGWYKRRWPDRWSEKPKTGRAWAGRNTWEKFRIAQAVRMPSKYWSLSALPPSIETDGWLKHRMIKWARGRAATA